MLKQALRHHPLWVIAAGALLLRAGFVLWTDNTDAVRTYECGEIARHMLSGFGYSMSLHGSPIQPTAHQYPFYCLLVAGHMSLFDNPWLWLELLQATLGALTCVCVGMLGGKLHSPRVGLWAATLTAVYPVYVYWTARTQALTVEVFLLALLLVLLVQAFEQPDKARRWCGAGVILGAAMLSKALYVVLIPAFVLWGAWGFGLAPRRLARGFAMVLITACVVIAPWTVRNAITLDAVVPISSNGGYNLWVGNNPNATGTVFTANAEPMPRSIPEDTRRQLAQMSDLEQDRWFLGTALDYIKVSPTRFLANMLPKLKAFWWFDDFVPTRFPIARKIVYLLLLALAVPGVFVARDRRAQLSIFWLMPLTMSAAYAVFYGSPRFRYVIEFGFLVFAAVTFLHFARALISVHRRSSLV